MISFFENVHSFMILLRKVGLFCRNMANELKTEYELNDVDSYVVEKPFFA